MASKDGRVPSIRNLEESKAYDSSTSEELSQASQPRTESSLRSTSPFAEDPFSFRPVQDATSPTNYPERIHSRDSDGRTVPSNEPCEHAPKTWAKKVLDICKSRPTIARNTISTKPPAPPSPVSAYASSTPTVVKKTPTPIPTSTKDKKKRHAVSSPSSVDSRQEEEEETPVAGPRKKTRSNENFLNSRAHLQYSWKSLGLGKHTGSAALNQALARNGGGTPHLTSFQTLQIVNSLQMNTIVPPEKSPLHKVIQTVRILLPFWLLYMPRN